MPGKRLPHCQYGSKCYRKNPQHYQEYWHDHLPNNVPPHLAPSPPKKPVRHHQHQHQHQHQQQAAPARQKRVLPAAAAPDAATVKKTKHTAKPAVAAAAPATAAAPAVATAAPAADHGQNAKIATILQDLGGIEKMKGDVHRATAYFRAAGAIKQHATPITSGKEAEAIKGIGKKIAKKIDEILATGKLKKLENEQHDDRNIALKALGSVHGIGPKLAAKLLLEHKITSLQELAANQHLLNATQKVGLKYVHEFQQRIPRAEVAELEAIVKEEAHHIHPHLEVQVCGSYRRGQASSGDIDILMTDPHFHKGDPPSAMLTKLVDRLHKRGFITDDLAKGPAKYMGVCILPPKQPAAAAAAAPPKPNAGFAFKIPKLVDVEKTQDDDAAIADAIQAAAQVDPVKAAVGAGAGAGATTNSFQPAAPAAAKHVHRRIDIRLLPIESYWCGVLYFTGSQFLNIALRQEAIAKGLHLSEYSLCKLKPDGKPGEPLKVTCEKDVFDYLGLPYKEPTQRNDGKVK